MEQQIRAIAVCLACALASCTPASTEPGGAEETTTDSLAVYLDHVPIAVRDLAVAQATFRALGFTLKPGRLHANTLDNAHAKFRDGTELELITAVEPKDDVAAGYLDFLAAGDGAAYLALAVDSLDALERRLRARGHLLSVVRGNAVAWVAIEPPDPLAYLFFVDGTKRVQDPPEILTHANTARALHAVWLATDDFSAEKSLLTSFGVEVEGEPITLPPLALSGRRVALHSGDLYLLPRPPAFSEERKILGVTVEVEDIMQTKSVLEENLGGSFEVMETARGRSLLVPPALAPGVWIEFLQE